MAVRYIAVDSGKFATKVAEYDIQKKAVRKFSIRTKASDGDFRDDAIEKNTVVVEIDGVTYKIGNGARGSGVELETNKQSEVHRLCTLTVIAMLASSDEKDEINVAIGLPAKDWAVISKRMDYKDYILPNGDVSIKIKRNSDTPEIIKEFTIKSKYVFPESIGALFMDETIADIETNTITGVLDLGNLNLNATLWQGTELVQDKSSTAEYGGSILIQELSQEITANITPCDELITANILKLPPDNRHLPDNLNLTKEQVEDSKVLIKRVLKGHADKVKRCCHARNWSLDVTRIIAIGGTSQDIETELKEVFGNITILPNANYCNVLGYLRMMCARIPEINDVIPLTDIKAVTEETQAKNKKENSPEKQG